MNDPSEVEQIGHLTMAELKDTPVTLGKAHMVKSFEEVWTTSPSWIKWFLGALCLKLQNRALQNDQVHSEEPPEVIGHQGISLSPSRGGRRARPGVLRANENKEEIHALQSRMLNLETAMQRMLMMLQNAMPLQTSGPPPHLDAVDSVWDDPWNN